MRNDEARYMRDRNPIAIRDRCSAVEYLQLCHQDTFTIDIFISF